MPESVYFFILYFVAIILLLGVFVLLPVRQRARQKRQLLAALTPGDTVITAGGVLARIVKREEDTLIVELFEGSECKMRILTQTVQGVVKRAG